jgi:hypothetical protein
MSCRIEHGDRFLYRFCPDTVPAAGNRLRALIRARLVDELTGEPVETDIALSTDSPGLSTRVARGGLVGLAGHPGRLFPQLDIASVSLGMRVVSPRYVPRDLAGTLGPIAGFPDQFTPVDLGDVTMHRAATTLRGRTLRRGSLAPGVVTGASVEIVGYWPVFPPANVVPATVMEPPDLVALSPPVYAARADGVTQVRQRGAVAMPGLDKTLLLPASAGAIRVRLSDRDGLAAGVLLIIAAADAMRRERIIVASVDTASSVDQPAWVTLSHPLAYTQLDGTLCQPANLLAGAAPNLLTRAAIPGDATLYLDGLTALAAGVTVEMDDGGGTPEYHDADLYRSVSDAAGYFRLPPLARAAMVALHAQRLGLVSPADEARTPDYRLAENALTVMFP